MYWSIESCSGIDARARERWRRLELWADRISLLGFGVLALIMIATVPDYGLTYDEPPHVRLGERVLWFYTNGFGHSNTLARSSYGAGFDLCAALLRRISPWDEYRTNHVLCVFVAQLGLLGTWKLGRALAGPAGALAALLLLVLNPVYYGHQFNNPKDVPFAVGYVWGLYAIARLLAWSPAPGERWQRSVPRALLLALTLGLAMSVRIAGAVLIGYLFAFTLLRALDAVRLKQGLERRHALRAAAALALLGAAGALGGWAVMLPFWPGALEKPLDKPVAALETISNFVNYDSPTLLRGAHISSNHLPWDYLPTYFAVQLPEGVSLCWSLSLLALCAHTAWCVRRRRPVAWLGWLLVVATLLPPAYAIVRRSTLYNGLRHFLFLMPPISALAGAGLTSAVAWLTLRRPRWALVPALLFGLFTLDQLRALVSLHPFQHVYFNRASGGVAAAVDRYETEYYGAVYQQLHAQLIERIWDERRDSYLKQTFSVAGCGSKLFFTRNLPLNFQYTTLRDANRADFYATYVRDDCLHRFRNRALITTVEREGALLAAARDMKAKVGRKPAGSSR
ncbi:MAG TPA: hypothetical protein VFS67_02395 [Polyangiaceae bacterium]|nr:hypothetical protein [Polyangiaceae bacterium]